jgi:hypothetical protein
MQRNVLICARAEGAIGVCRPYIYRYVCLVVTGERHDCVLVKDTNCVQKDLGSTGGRGRDLLNQFLSVFLRRLKSWRLTARGVLLSSDRQCMTSENNQKLSTDTSDPERMLGVRYLIVKSINWYVLSLTHNGGGVRLRLLPRTEWLCTVLGCDYCPGRSGCVQC